MHTDNFAAYDFLSNLMILDVQFKWPNDLVAKNSHINVSIRFKRRLVDTVAAKHKCNHNTFNLF